MIIGDTQKEYPIVGKVGEFVLCDDEDDVSWIDQVHLSAYPGGVCLVLYNGGDFGNTELAITPDAARQLAKRLMEEADKANA